MPNTDRPSNKSVAQSFCRALATVDIDTMESLFADGATWWILGDKSLFSAAGTYQAKQVISHLLVRDMDRWTFQVLNLLVDGPDIVVVGSGEGAGPGDNLYKNDYIFYFKICGRKIIELREYFDLMAAADYMRRVGRWLDARSDCARRRG